MTEYVRVREGAWEYTVERRLLVDDDRLTVLDKNPFAPNGDPAAPKPVMPLGEPAPGTRMDRERTQMTVAKGGGKDAGQSSADNKEN